MLDRVWRKGNAPHCWWERKLVQPLWKTLWSFLRKLKIELTYDPAIPLLGIYLEKMETLIQKDTCTSIFIVALFTIDKTWKQHKCPLEEWIKKMWHMCVCVCVCIYIYIYIYLYIYIYKIEYYSTIKIMKYCYLQQHGWT